MLFFFLDLFGGNQKSRNFALAIKPERVLK